MNPVRWAEPEDRDAVIAFTRETGLFRPDEIEVAAELLDEALDKGPDGHYQSYTAHRGGAPIGWICFGPTPCTVHTYDLYWIVVAPDSQKRGVGSMLLGHAERLIAARGGRLAVAETSGRDLYASTRQFYLRCGYHEAARIPEFYAPGDDKLMYVKKLQ